MTPKSNPAAGRGFLDRLRAGALERAAVGQTRSLRAREPVSTTVDLAGNDYLGLSTDPRVVEAAAVAGAAAFLDHGLRVGCFRPPSVPDGVSRLRLTARATLTGAELARVADRVRAVLDDLRSS